MQTDNKRKLVVVSNRLPVVLTTNSENKCEIKPASGGLVTAMSPVLKTSGGTWIGWAGNYSEENLNVDELLKETNHCSAYSCKSVDIGLQDYEMYYKGFSNEVLWPLFHNVSVYCNYSEDYYKAYERVNRKFAMTIANEIGDNDFIWIHDYHLIHSGKELRKKGIQNTIAFFLHIPFPPLETFNRIPWRLEIVEAMLSYTIIGFQTEMDKKNFLEVVALFADNATVYDKDPTSKILSKFGITRLSVLPISIDYEEFHDLAKSDKVSKMTYDMKKGYDGQTIMLGIDRLDYSKGIPQRLKAYRRLLECNPDLHKKIKLVQVMIPSREDISRYSELKSEVEELVGEINGRFSQLGWIPIQYCYHSLNREELISYYRASGIALITPLKDGMNLIAKEYCASNIDQDGVLILSEFAGAKDQLGNDALLVNPFDEESFVETIKTALSMNASEKQRRMEKMQNILKSFDIYWWVDSFLNIAKKI